MRIEEAAFQLGHRQVVVGRLFNRFMVPQPKDFADDVYDERLWHSAETTMLAGGGFFPYQEGLNSLNNTDSNSSFDTTVHNEGGNNTKKSSASKENSCASSRIDDLPLQQNCHQPQHLRRQDDDKLSVGPWVDNEALDNPTRNPPREMRQPREETTDDDSYDDSIEDQSKFLSYTAQSPSLSERMHKQFSPTQAPSTHKKLSSKKKLSSSMLVTNTSKTEIAIQRRKKKQDQPRVEFVGSTHLLMKSDQLDSVLCCEFVDLVEVRLIPSFSEYHPNALEELWYTQEDIQRMKQDSASLRKQNRRRKRRRHPPPPFSTPASPPQSDCPRPPLAPHHHPRISRHTPHQQRALVAAVLQEQHRQRTIYRWIYGGGCPRDRSDYDGIVDPDRLRKVYRSIGKTEQRREEARLRAEATAAAAAASSSPRERPEVIRNGDEEDHRNLREAAAPHNDAGAFESPTTSAAPGTEDKPRHSIIRRHREKPSVEERFPPMTDSDIDLDVSTPCFDCIGLVFFSLLSPLFQARNDPLFLEIEDEILVA